MSKAEIRVVMERSQIDRLYEPYTVDENFTFGQLLHCAQDVIGEAIKRPENAGRPGGCLLICKRGKFPHLYQFGEMLKPEKYPKFALAKARLLLYDLPEARLSGENLSRDEASRYKIEYDGKLSDVPHGAVATQDGWVVAFSGFEQEWDAAVVLSLLERANLMSWNEINAILVHTPLTSTERTIGGCFEKLFLY